MDVFALFSARIANAMQVLFPEVGADLLARIVVEPPRDASHGDLSTNAAMIVAKPLGKNPREVANTLVEHFKHDSDVTSVEVAGPGFINFRLDTPIWHQVLKSVAEQGADYGRSTLGGGEAVNIEYVSANPTGPMHVGHTRGAVFGDTLASLMAYSGYEVTREYYINDTGGQTIILGKSALLRYREALGETIEIPSGYYPGPYLIPVGQALAAEYGASLLDKPEEDAVLIAREAALAGMMELVKADLAQLNIHHDTFFSERVLHGAGGDIELTLAWLREKGMVYEGRLEAPKGKTPEEWEDREQTLFRATDYGDDTDRALIKSDGSYTYFAADIAYHRNKFLRGFNHMINVLGADHSGYVKRLQAAVKAVSLDAADMDVRICQLVRLLKNGEPFKMSKRSGDLVLLSDVVEEVGVDATRFMLMYRRNDAAMDFDFAVVKEQSKDNPVFYVQYAHARTHSIFKTAARDMPDLDVSPAALAAAEVDRIVTPAELDLIRVLAAWPRTVTAAAIAHEPHRVAFYVHELAAAFHGFWAKGSADASLRFVNAEDPKLTLARLALVDAVRQVIANALAILGVSAPEELS
ncbi:MAG: arginine--tRNA ligase [Candidatus Devosia phytovorans]|uniref:Arginine--tRNA ligase n=1 Tax=Candidatus Devosia phytovorans TaxID=3121372 RepID=A0AAJ6B3E4_9HYPH|nr:arginine--tRNA ligase [Devosia sp.]WEK06338.1 MAG: arginine--tRNA ligase [Devosia sp.]